MDDPLERAKGELEQYRSILAMIKGNTPNNALKAVEQTWLDPLSDMIKEFESH